MKVSRSWDTNLNRRSFYNPSTILQHAFIRLLGRFLKFIWSTKNVRLLNINSRSIAFDSGQDATDMQVRVSNVHSIDQGKRRVPVLTYV